MNGWKNKETWLVALHFRDFLVSQFEDDGTIIDANHVETMVYDYIDTVAPYNADNVFFNDLVTVFMESVDVEQIANSCNEITQAIEESRCQY